MEKVEYRTQEEKEVCDWIHGQRRYAKKFLLNKRISITFDEIDNHLLNAVSNIMFNQITGNISFGHVLQMTYKGHNNQIAPTKNQKLRCTNQHSLEQFKKFKKQMNKKRAYTFRFHTYLQEYLYLNEEISYYRDTGNVSSSVYFQSWKYKLKVIDELDHI